MKTEVVIIGGGPSGLLLSQLLNDAGVSTVVLERTTREHVLSRIRAGVLEDGTMNLLRHAGVGARMDQQGLPHKGCYLTDNDLMVHIDFHKLIGKKVMVYGQTEVTRDLYDAQDRMGTTIIHEVEDVVIDGADSNAPTVSFTKDGQRQEISCTYVAGCDGFHGVSRATIPAAKRREFERVYPFGWLGILSRTKPVNDELIYASSAQGFALASMRSASLSRYYIQVSSTEKVEEWSDDRFWEALKQRLPRPVSEALVTGPSIEKSIAPLRSFVAEPMRWGRLFLCGDAAHIVPPTGAKGLNTAASDVHYLYEGLVHYYQDKDSHGIDTYSEKALARIWKAERFSWATTNMLHRFPDQSDFDLKMQRAEIESLHHNETAQKWFAQNYVGLPY